MKKIHDTFTAEELSLVELLPQFVDAPECHFTKAGRSFGKDGKQFVENEDGATISCITGFVINIAEHLTGEILIDKKFFTNLDEFKKTISSGDSVATTTDIIQTTMIITTTTELAEAETTLLAATQVAVTAVVISIYHKAGDYVRTGEPIFLLSDFGELQESAVIEHNKLKALLSHGTNFILEVPFYRLTHRIYPITQSLQTVADLERNQFPVRVENILPSLSEKSDYHEVTWRIANHSGILEPTYRKEQIFKIGDNFFHQ